MLAKDSYHKSPERYPRWLEIFTSYCHEMAHLYAAYLSLSYQGGPTCRTPVTCSIDPFPKDSGFFFQKHLFGGILIRWAYMSRRNYRYMVSLAIFQNLSLGAMIPFDIPTSCPSNSKHMSFAPVLEHLGNCSVELNDTWSAIYPCCSTMFLGEATVSLSTTSLFTLRAIQSWVSKSISY